MIKYHSRWFNPKYKELCKLMMKHFDHQCFSQSMNCNPYPIDADFICIFTTMCHNDYIQHTATVSWSDRNRGASKENIATTIWKHDTSIFVLVAVCFISNRIQQWNTNKKNVMINSLGIDADFIRIYTPQRAKMTPYNLQTYAKITGMKAIWCVHTPYEQWHKSFYRVGGGWGG